MSRLPLLPDRERPLFFAHRGCSSLAPENTMTSFRLAREWSSPGLELDIHLCATGELVVAHDDSFARTAPGQAGERKIETLSWEEIRAIDVGSFFGPSFRSGRCPLLQDVLEEFCPDLYIDIELKTRRVSGDPLPEKTAALLDRMGPRIAGAVTVSSFNPFALRAFRKAALAFGPASAPAKVPLGVIYCVDTEVPWILRRGAGRFIAAADYAKPKHDLAGPLAVLAISRIEGRPLVPWTVDDPLLGAALVERGCAGIISNCPQLYAGSRKDPAIAGG